MSQVAKDAAKLLKNTLRLPTSTFPARPPPADLVKYLPRCTDDLYEWQRRERPAANSFVLHDGPPYANGGLHVGHALNKIIKDIICRTKLAEGKRVDYVPGWDCHGLPIELKALEHHGWNISRGVDAVSIREAARQFANETIKEQMAGFRSWAVMGDWNKHWRTMDNSFEIRQLAVFKAMAQKGLIYRRFKPVYWSPSSQTALAEAELEYKDDHKSIAALVKYPLHGLVSKSNSIPHAVVWTTTPWTLPANQAVAINSSFQYSRLKSSQHGELIIAQPRISYVEELIGEQLEVIDEIVSTEALLQSTYSGPSEFGHGAMKRPIVHADFVMADSGTGLVHCAPGHGMEDYEALQPLIRSGHVEVKAPVDNAGNFDVSASPANPGSLQGQSIFKAGTDSVIRLFQESGLFVHQHEYKHKYPIDWRTKEPVIIRATAQWFADISQIKKDALQALDSVDFLPSAAKSRLRSFVESRSEWCISRQRAWGVPIPALYNKDDGQAVLTSESIDHIVKVIEERGIDAWWSDPLDDPAWILPNLSSGEYLRGTDTMDVWFDSGTSWTLLPEANDHQSSGPLADVYVEGTDQHRGWFQSSLLTRIAYQKSFQQQSPLFAPFRTLLTHGFTLDAQGKKMSKSLGNVIAPAQIIAGVPTATKSSSTKSSKNNREVHSLGPDALRLWTASSDWMKDVVISDSVIKTVHTNLDKYRVTFKLLLGLLHDFNPNNLVQYDLLSTLDKLALLHLYTVSNNVRAAYTGYEFHKAVTAINRWVVADLSGFYIEAIKDVMYCEDPSSIRRQSAQTVLHYILREIQSMLGPLTPLLVEESWQHSSEIYKASLEPPLRRIWHQVPVEWQDEQLGIIWPYITGINSSVKAAQEQARSARWMGQSLASDVDLFIHPDCGRGLQTISLDSWKEMLVVSEVTVKVNPDFLAQAGQHRSIKATQGWSISQGIDVDDTGLFGVAVVSKPQHEKCVRCWKYTVQFTPESAVAGDKSLPLCSRCASTVAEYNTH